MSFAADQVEPLKERCDSVSVCNEGGTDYLVLQGLRLPAGCSPSAVDALLCPTARDGYTSRLFFAAQLTCAATLNWNGQNIRILERNWFAYSWKIRDGLTLQDMLSEHLAPLRA